eukprot:6210257-Pleurochrysis_carterae.AAC.1
MSSDGNHEFGNHELGWVLHGLERRGAGWRMDGDGCWQQVCHEMPSGCSECGAGAEERRRRREAAETYLHPVCARTQQYSLEEKPEIREKGGCEGGGRERGAHSRSRSGGASEGDTAQACYAPMSL